MFESLLSHQTILFKNNAEKKKKTSLSYTPTKKKKQKPYTHLSPPPPPPFRIHHYTATHKKQNPHKFSTKKNRHPLSARASFELPSSSQRVSSPRHHSKISKIEKKTSSSFTVPQRKTKTSYQKHDHKNTSQRS